MATKAEQFHANEQRHRGKGKKPRTSIKKPKKAAWSRASVHAASKATHAIEETSRGARPSRESTRASANRGRPDVAMNLKEEKTRGSPENRARRSRAQSVKVRGHTR
jgi:hypothetical protein